MKILLLLLAAATSCSPYFFNPIRQGSVASRERVIDRATGKPLEWEVVGGRVRVSFVNDRDDQLPVKIVGRNRPCMFDLDSGLPLHTHTVSGKEVTVRIRVEETYTDPVGYTVENGELVESPCASPTSETTSFQ
ncbi:MAG TPA: hypothetical protein VE959_04785 [Bryobacteraceae bacterium]|nr:hypothetical protein [Bryobacteraceae bacterium]